MVAAMGLASDYCPLYGICWAPFGHAGGAAGLPVDVLCLLVCRFLGKNLAWSSTANDDGTMGIIFLLEGVTVRTSTYTDRSRWKPMNRHTGSGSSSILRLLSFWGVVLESLMATPRSAWSTGGGWSVCIVEIDLLRFQDHRVTRRRMTTNDPYIKSF